jgi:3-dehydroquinate synthase II
VPFDRIVLRPTADDATVERRTVEYALRRGFRRFAVAGDVPLPDGAERVGLFADRFETLGTGSVPRTTVATPDDLADAVALARTVGAVAIEWAGDRVIPLESAVASRRGDFQLWVGTARPSQVPAFLGALEHGADVVVVAVASPADVALLEAALDAGPRPPVHWEDAVVRAIRPAGLSDRVLLDTTSLLGASEGFAIGSRAALLFLVLSEAEGSTFSRPRPFRVNAGAPHSYVLMADGTTRYLSEVEPGEELLAVSESGSSRGVRLGRRKVERRPTVLLEAELGGATATIFLQEAETVRLWSATGPVRVTDLAAGATVHAVAFPPGRHLGETVAETVEER